MTLPAPVCYYTTPRAPNGRRTDIFIAEKGIDLPTKAINLMEGEHKRPEYLEKTGSPQIPALELADGAVLVETQAICRYLEALHPEPNMMGRDALEIATVEMWQRRIEMRLMATIAFAFRHLNPKMAALEDQSPDWGETNRGRIDGRLAELDRQLQGREFVCCDRLTVADITGLVAVDFLRLIRHPVPDGMTALRAWHERMRARPSAAM